VVNSARVGKLPGIAQIPFRAEIRKIFAVVLFFDGVAGDCGDLFAYGLFHKIGPQLGAESRQ
jgi:hypothetical protein